MPLPSIHSSPHTHSYTDCNGLVTESSQEQTSKRASESIAQETERKRARNGRAAPQVKANPAPKQAHSLARLLAHTRLAAFAHTSRTSRHCHQFVSLHGAQTTNARSTQRRIASPPLPSCLPLSRHSSLHPLLPSTSAARARVRAPKQRRVRPLQSSSSIPAPSLPSLSSCPHACPPSLTQTQTEE